MKSTLKKFACFVAAFLLVAGSSFGTAVRSASAERVVLEEVSIENRYYDAPVPSSRAAGDSEIITFATKDDTYIGTPNNVPYYYNYTLENACGAVAGGIVAGYYDKYFENLIPGYTNYYTATGKYRPQDSVYVPATIQSMYTAMQTNVAGPGVSAAECRNGLQSYVQGQGYSLSYTTVKAYNGSFNHTAYQNAINNGQPVLLFCNAIELWSLDSGDTQDEAILAQISQDHIIVGYGYKKVKYYNASNYNFRTEIYLKVASGWYINNMGYIKVNNDGWLDSAYAVDVY